MISPELLRRYPFFGFMNDDQLKGVAMIAEEVTFDQGDTILEANQPATHLFFLEEGSAGYYYVVTTEHDPDYRQEYYISDFNPGEIFGISAMIEPYLYTATVRASKPCRVIRIDASALRALCEVDHNLSCGLLRAVSKAAMERLQNTRVQLIAAKP
ncbi:MAG: cyclic nucleotide-binding domain-containing protein [Anaerolineae bacterium]|nr:MAG: cyclic nucleotide-binding domain-containing protein [Anaerolineae bacterium]